MVWRRPAGLLNDLCGAIPVQRALRRRLARLVRAPYGFGDLDCGRPYGEAPTIPQTMLIHLRHHGPGELAYPRRNSPADPGDWRVAPAAPRRQLAVDRGADSPGSGDDRLADVVWDVPEPMTVVRQRETARTNRPPTQISESEDFQQAPESMDLRCVGLGLTRRAATLYCGGHTPTSAGQMRPTARVAESSTA